MTKTPDPVFPQVLLIVFDLPAAESGNRPLRQILGWKDPDRLVERFVADIKDVSSGFCNYQIAQKLTVPGFPVKEDGFRYAGDDYLHAWKRRAGFHKPDWADYTQIMVDFDIPRRTSSEEIDEVWMFAGPYAGFYESRMAGPGAFWCNAPPLDGFSRMGRRLVLMGFNYERGVGEMLESYGHRAESIMERVFRHQRGSENLWRRFIRHEQSHPGAAEVGNVHFAPNSQRDYDWGNPRVVPSRCDSWLSFPDLTGPTRVVDCREWGSGDIRLHHLWWFRHFPHFDGKFAGVSQNWWEYVVDPNRLD